MKKLIDLGSKYCNLLMSLLQLPGAAYSFCVGDFTTGLVHLLLCTFFWWAHKSKAYRQEQLKREIQALREQYSRSLHAEQQPEKKAAGDCVGCKYYHGSGGLVCAVHPSGYEEEFCVDKEIKERSRLKIT